MNRGREVKSLSGFGAIIQTEQSKALETESQYSNQIRSIGKRLTNGFKSPSDTGYAGIILTEGTKNHKKKRDCEEWIKIPITDQMKCRKFKYNGPITFPDSPILQSIQEDHPYKEQIVNRQKIKESSQLPTYN